LIHPIVNVRAIVVERTFWEKVTILHHEANRPEASSLPLRYSRHYYELAMLASSNIKDSALSKIELLKEVIEFKQKFYPRVWAKYEECLAGKLKLIPAEIRFKELKQDYLSMRVMIFGSYPEFNKIINILDSLEQKINLLLKT
jgi:hypothetical protein